MSYVDYEYYVSTYGGTVIAADKAHRAFRNASDAVDALTHCRIVERGLDGLTAFQKGIVQRVVCDLAEWQEKKLRYDNYANSPDYTLGGVANPGAAPTAPTHYSRTESISYFIISCAMGVDRRMKKYPISVAEHEEQRATGRRVIK